MDSTTSCMQLQSVDDLYQKITRPTQYLLVTLGVPKLKWKWGPGVLSRDIWTTRPKYYRTPTSALPQAHFQVRRCQVQKKASQRLVSIYMYQCDNRYTWKTTVTLTHALHEGGCWWIELSSCQHKARVVLTEGSAMTQYFVQDFEMAWFQEWISWFLTDFLISRRLLSEVISRFLPWSLKISIIHFIQICWISGLEWFFVACFYHIHWHFPLRTPQKIHWLLTRCHSIDISRFVQVQKCIGHTL